jgi:peptide/nickel transport system substrate-binding protein
MGRGAVLARAAKPGTFPRSRLQPCWTTDNPVSHRTMTSFSRFTRATAAALLIGCAGCGQHSKTPTGHPLPNPLVSKAAPGKAGGRFVIASPGAPKTFNPLFAADVASDSIVRLMVGSLVNVDPLNHQPGPGLAESWTVEPDQKTWTFKLRRGLRWSDGQPLTAADVVFTWNQVMYNPDFNRLTFDLFQIGGKRFDVSQVDETTVRVVTPAVFAPFLEFFGTVPVLPRHTLENAAQAKVFPAAYGLKVPPDKIVGCGPFRLKEYQPGKSTLLERNPEYWVSDNAGRRLPYFDEVLFLAGTEPGSDARMFLAGKSDVYDLVRLEFLDEFKQASAKARFDILELGPGTERDFFWFNQNTGTNALGKPIVNPAHLKWFRNKKFRQAISCAIDRERMVREIYQGRGRSIHGFFSSENPKWNNPNIPQFGYDSARARALLAEIGIQDRNGDGLAEDAEGNPLEISLHSNSDNLLRQLAAQLIQDDFKKLGIKLNYLAIDFRSLVEKINATFDYECALMGLGGGGVDPASQLNVLKSSEELHQWFPFQKTPSTEWEARIDALMDAQMRTLDYAQRKKAFDEVQQILGEEMPMIYTISPFSYSALRTGVANARPSVLTPYRVTWNLEELYFK